MISAFTGPSTRDQLPEIEESVRAGTSHTGPRNRRSQSGQSGQL